MDMRLLILFAIAVLGFAQPGPPLKLEATIPLPGVEGRIDHLSVDVNNQRLFVAALGNNTVEVLDIKGAKRLHTISGLREPQGVLYVPGDNRLFVANAKDGTCRIYDAASFQLLQTIEYGDDADNIRFDAHAKQVYVGYGSGALGVLDPGGRKLGDIKLDAHPESFQLEKSGPRIFVNLPDSRKIAVVDRNKRAVVGHWETGGALSNFPMALDETNHRLFTFCRRPAVIVVLNTDFGAVVAKIPTVGRRVLRSNSETNLRIRRRGSHRRPPATGFRSLSGGRSHSNRERRPHEPLCSRPRASIPGRSKARF
jgi:DNA-binding beta-propeller fold protein YncE